MKFPQHFVIQSVAKDFGNILYVIKILPPYGRLNDKMIEENHSDIPPYLNYIPSEYSCKYRKRNLQPATSIESHFSLLEVKKKGYPIGIAFLNIIKY